MQLKSRARSGRLAELQYFGGCTHRELALASRLVDLIEVQAGTVLAQEQAPAHQVLIVVKGRVLILQAGVEVTTLGEGAVIGELAVLGATPNTRTAVAGGPVEVAVISARDFVSLLNNIPHIALGALRRAARRTHLSRSLG